MRCPPLVPSTVPIAVLAGGFSPAELPGLAFWAMADGVLWQDSARTTRATADGDPVGAWDDASGSARHATQATSGKRPTLKLAVQNGLPEVRWDGVDDSLATGSFAVAQPLTAFVVGRNRVANTNVENFLDALNGNGSDRFILGKTFTGAYRLYAGSATITGGTPDTAYHLFTGLASGASSTLRVDRTQVATGNPGSIGIPTGMRFGTDYAAGSQWLDGGIAELIIVASLSDANRDATESYLKAKWGTP